MFYTAILYLHCVLFFPQVAFFPAGSMLQLALSVLVSVAALVYHIYARPFRDSWLNGS